LLSFAIKTLFADRRKLYIALIGVVFSLVLVNIQGGMFLGLIRKSTLLVDHGEADIWIGHRGIQNADIAANIPVSWVHRVRGAEGVAQAEPYIVSASVMQLSNGFFEGVLVVGCDESSMLGGPWRFSRGSLDTLRQPEAISIDRLDEARLLHPQIGEVLEINGHRARIAAKTDGIVGFITTPYVFTTLNRARDYTSIPDGSCSYFLVKVRKGWPVEKVVRQIQARLPQADVYAARDFSDRTRWYWIVRTGLGMSFGSSTLLGLTVGLVMVAQSLYAFVLDHLESYAALKAIGGTDRQISWILATQGLVIAILGCLIGHATSLLFVAAVSSPQLYIAITPTLQILSTVLAVSICLVSSLLPLGRIRRVDPVTVLQGV
jgi:putative ABC transport system permease protein